MDKVQKPINPEKKILVNDKDMKSVWEGELAC
jgi:hypothetical protein